jgi:hypothetical protein
MARNSAIRTRFPFEADASNGALGYRPDAVVVGGNEDVKARRQEHWISSLVC